MGGLSRFIILRRLKGIVAFLFGKMKRASMTRMIEHDAPEESGFMLEPLWLIIDHGPNGHSTRQCVTHSWVNDVYDLHDPETLMPLTRSRIHKQDDDAITMTVPAAWKSRFLLISNHDAR